MFTPGDLPRAVERMVQSDGWEAALALETAHWDSFVSTHPEALLAALEALPGKAYVALPSLIVATNYLRHLIGGTDPRQFHDFAHDERGTNAKGRTPLDQLIASAGRTAGFRTSGQLQAALSQAASGRRILDGLSASARAELEMSLPHVLLQWGRAFEVNDAGGEREYEEAWTLGQLTGQLHIARRAAASLAWLHADHGELKQACLWIERAETLPAEDRYDVALYLAAALIAIDRLDRDATIARLEQIRGVPVGEYWAAELWVRAWAASSVADAALVEKDMNAALQVQSEAVASEGAVKRYLTAARVRIAATLNRPLPPAPAGTPLALDRIISGSTAYLSGNMHAVLREVVPASEDAWPRMQVMGLLLLAAARYSLGRAGGASVAFGAAHAIIEDEQLLSAYMVIQSQHLAGLASLTGIETPDYARLLAPSHASNSSVVLATLTRREREVLALLTAGHSLKAIADRLYISPNTVKGVTSGLYRKLGVHSREQAADFAHRASLA